MRPMSEILSDALASFEGGKRWMRGTLYPDHKENHGKAFHDELQEADRYCAYGAIFKTMTAHGELVDNPFTGKSYGDPIVSQVEKLLAPPGRMVVSMNDSATSFKEVKQMFCAGIKRALAEEQQEAIGQDDPAT